jgi:hypothetical protein
MCMKKIMFSVLVGFMLLSSCKKAVTELTEETLEAVGEIGVKKFSIEVEEQAIKKITGEVAEISVKSVSKIIPNRPYSRIAIDKEFKIIKAQMHNKALQRGAKENINSAFFKDAYTGKSLFGGGKYEFDHIRSAENIFNKYKTLLTDHEIAKVVNCQENVVAIQTDINRAKGKWDLEKLLDDDEKVKRLDINVPLAKQTATKADEAIKRKVQEIIKNRK